MTSGHDWNIEPGHSIAQVYKLIRAPIYEVLIEEHVVIPAKQNRFIHVAAVGSISFPIDSTYNEQLTPKSSGERGAPI